MQLGPASTPNYGGRDSRCIEVKIPPDAPRMVALSYTLLMTGVFGDEEENFTGEMIWLRDYDFGSQTFDRAGRLMLESVAGLTSDAARLEQYPACWYSPQELAAAHAALLIGCIFQWDMIAIPGSGQHLLSVSHDGVVQVITRTPSIFELVFERLEAGEWDLREKAIPEEFLGS